MKKIDQLQRAEEAWVILTDCAQKRKTIEYKKIANLVGTHQRAARFFLEPIQQHCKLNDLPPLTILAVNQAQKPGQGFTEWDVNNLDSGLKRVFSYPWHQVENPFKGSITKARGLGLERIIRQITSEWSHYKKNVKVSKDFPVYNTVEEIFPALLKHYVHSADFSSYPKINKEVLIFEGSTGQGNITMSPWIAIFDERNTSSARFGIYPVFLFSRDLKKLYLTLGIGATQFIDAYGTGGKTITMLSEAVRLIRDQFRESPYKPQNIKEIDIDLNAEKSDKLHYFYNNGIAFSFEPYDTNNINEEQIRQDFLDLVQFYQSIVDDPMLPSSEKLILRKMPQQSIKTSYKNFDPTDPFFKKKKSSGFSPENSKQVGDAGEDYVLKCEKKKLSDIGREDLVDQVIPHYKIADYCGWDITSFDEEGNEIYIEVKATQTDSVYGFIISANEWAKANDSEYADRYRIYRVLKALTKEPEVIVIKNIRSLISGNELVANPLAYKIDKRG